MWFYEEGEARKVAALLQQISAQKQALGHTAKTSSLVGKETFVSPRQWSLCVIVLLSAAGHHLELFASSEFILIDLMRLFILFSPVVKVSVPACILLWARPESSMQCSGITFRIFLLSCRESGR